MQLTFDFSEATRPDPKDQGPYPIPKTKAPAATDAKTNAYTKTPESKALSSEQLSALLSQCHETLRDGGRISSHAAFHEFVRIIFLKYRDELQPTGEPPVFQQRYGENDQQRAQRIRRFYESQTELEPQAHTGSIDSTPDVLARCARHLDGISLTRTQADIAGAAFQEFTTKFAKGDLGQYFTSREVVALAIEMMQPQPEHRILDPACGSGGFLAHALEYMRRQAAPTPADNCHGIEINHDLARVAKMNMLVQGANPSNIVCRDALAVMSPEDNHTWKEQFDLVFANPPFGGTIRRADKGDGYLDQYEIMHYLGNNSSPGPGAVKKSATTSKPR